MNGFLLLGGLPTNPRPLRLFSSREEALQFASNLSREEVLAKAAAYEHLTVRDLESFDDGVVALDLVEFEDGCVVTHHPALGKMVPVYAEHTDRPMHYQIVRRWGKDEREVCEQVS